MTSAESAGNRPHRDGTGRFLPGHRLGGRPRGVDLRALVEERAATDPTIGSVEDLLWNVVVVLARRAALGDVPAAKLLLDHLAAPPDAPAVAELDDGMTELARVDRLVAILRAARLRRVNAAPSLSRVSPHDEQACDTGPSHPDRGSAP